MKLKSRLGVFYDKKWIRRIPQLPGPTWYELL